MPLFSVVIPVYNRADVLGELRLVEDDGGAGHGAPHRPAPAASATPPAPKGCWSATSRRMMPSAFTWSCRHGRMTLPASPPSHAREKSLR